MCLAAAANHGRQIVHLDTGNPVGRCYGLQKRNVGVECGAERTIEELQATGLVYTYNMLGRIIGKVTPAK